MKLNNKSVYFYLNADHKIGSGHFWRCLYMAEELASRGTDIVFIYSSISPELLYRLNDINFYHSPLTELSAESFISIIRNRNNALNSTLLIIDSDDTFFYSPQFQQTIIGAAIKLMIITINPDFHYHANILLNQNIMACYQQYSTDSITQKLFGPEYFIFSPSFRKVGLLSQKPLGTNVLIAFGSADPCNYTLELITQITKSSDLNQFKFEVVVGGLSKQYAAIKEICDADNRFNLYYNTTTIIDVMTKCNLAICSPGLMFWELALVGVRSILFSSSVRERAVATFLHQKKFAYTFHHFDEELTLSKFHIFKNVLLNINDRQFDGFPLLREKLNPNGIKKIIEVIDNVISE